MVIMICVIMVVASTVVIIIIVHALVMICILIVTVRVISVSRVSNLLEYFKALSLKNVDVGLKFFCLLQLVRSLI